MIGWLALMGCPVFQWNEPVVSVDTGTSSVAPTGHTGATGTVTETSTTTETGEAPTGDTGTVVIPECTVSSWTGDVALVPTLGSFTTRGQVLPFDWQGASGLIHYGPGKLNFELYFERFVGQKQVTESLFASSDWPPYFQSLQVIPDVTGDGQDDLLMNSYLELFLGSPNDPRAFRMSYSRNQGSGQLCQTDNTIVPQNAIVAAPQLFGGASGVDVLVACPTTSGNELLLGWTVDVGVGPQVDFAQNVVDITFDFTGVGLSGLDMMAAYEGPTPGVWVAHMSDIYGAGQNARINLIPHAVAAPTTPFVVDDVADLRLFIDSGSRMNAFDTIRPQVRSDDIDGDGLPDLLGLLPTDLTGEPNQPMELIVFTDVEARISAGVRQVMATEATYRVQGGSNERLVGPIRFMDHPGTANDLLLVRTYRPSSRTFSVVALPARLPAAVNLLADVEVGRLSSTAETFADLFEVAGDLDGDGCRDLVLQVPTLFQYRDDTSDTGGSYLSGHFGDGSVSVFSGG